MTLILLDFFRPVVPGLTKPPPPIEAAPAPGALNPPAPAPELLTAPAQIK